MSGCKICNSKGSGWTDVSALCGAGEICRGGVCHLKNNRYTCDNPLETQGCRWCWGWGNVWVDDGSRCPGGYSCYNGACITGQPLIPTEFDLIVELAGNVATARNKSGHVVSSGTDHSAVIRAAVAATPDDGSLYIGPGTYIMEADQYVQRPWTANADFYWYAAVPIIQQNIHIYGAGMNKTVLKLADGQYYKNLSVNHSAIIIAAVGGNAINSSGGFLASDSYDAFTLANITFDGNKENQQSFYNDAGLVLTGGKRSNGRFFNLEFRNSPSGGIYWGYNGNGREAYAYMDNIYSHDNWAWGIVFDTTINVLARNLVSENDAYGDVEPTAPWITQETVKHAGIFIMGGLRAYANGNPQNMVLENVSVKNGVFRIAGALNVVITDLSINTRGTDFNGLLDIFDSEEITVGVDSILGKRADNSTAFYCYQSSNISLKGGMFNGGIGVFANNCSVNVTDARLTSSFDTLYAWDGIIRCFGCGLEPANGTYMYSSIGSSAAILFNDSSTTSMQSTYVNGGAVYGSLQITSPKINYLYAWDYSHGQYQLGPGECMHWGDTVLFYMQFSDRSTPNSDMRYADGGNPRLWAGIDYDVLGWNLINGAETSYYSADDYWRYLWTIPSSAPLDGDGIEYYTWRAKNKNDAEVSGWQTGGGFNICCSPVNHSCSSGVDCCSGLCVGAICATTTTTSSTSTTTSTTSIVSSTTTTSTYSTSSSTIPGECAMPGNNVPCGVVSLSEVVDSINRWAAGNLNLGQVIDLITSWADPAAYPPT